METALGTFSLTAMKMMDQDMRKNESREAAPSPAVEELCAAVVDTAFHIHKELGPGLLESIYGVILGRALERQGLWVMREVLVSFEYDGMKFINGFRVDLLVNRELVIELKSVEALARVHHKQTYTYLRLLGLPLGLLINFGAARFKDGCK